MLQLHDACLSACNLILPSDTWGMTVAYDSVTNACHVCSDHFLVEDYKWTHVRKLLKHTAVPSVFNWEQPPALHTGKATNSPFTE